MANVVGCMIVQLPLVTGTNEVKCRRAGKGSTVNLKKIFFGDMLSKIP